MRIDRKLKMFVVCTLTILSSLFISVGWGEVDIKKAIIGKWERHDPEYEGKDTMEFFEDGTVSGFHEGLGLSVAGDYKFIDNRTIRISLA